MPLVSQVSYVNQNEHDVSVIVTEQSLADLRGLMPKQRAHTFIANCTHPDYRGALQDYFDRNLKHSYGKHATAPATEGAFAAPAAAGYRQHEGLSRPPPLATQHSS